MARYSEDFRDQVVRKMMAPNAKTVAEVSRETGTVLDIDYRPVLWGVAEHADGESRSAVADSVTKHIQNILPLFDLIIGTEEEVRIAGGSTDTVAALQAIRQLSDTTIVLKRGPLGCVVFDAAIPGDIDDGFLAEGVEVDVHNVVGAGDAFMSGFMRGWVQDKSIEAACRYGNACGAVVVTRHQCALAIPTKLELDDFLERRRSNPGLRPDSRLDLLHRLTSRKQDNRDLYVLAFDHRVQLEEMAKEQGVNTSQIVKLKEIIGQALRLARDRSDMDGRIGLIVDSCYGAGVLAKFTDTDCWIARPVELPMSKAARVSNGCSCILCTNRPASGCAPGSSAQPGALGTGATGLGGTGTRRCAFAGPAVESAAVGDCAGFLCAPAGLPESGQDQGGVSIL